MIEYPFGISGGVFSSIADDSTLYVPQGTKDAYESTNYWKHYFSNIVELNAMGISEVKPRQTAEGYVVYDPNGKKVSVKGGGLKSLPHGIYVVNGKTAYGIANLSPHPCKAETAEGRKEYGNKTSGA